jgi:hypothetical protein
MTAPVFDPFEIRAHTAARAAHHAVEGITMTDLAAPSRPVTSRAPLRVFVAATAAIVLVIAGTWFARDVLTRDESIPAFDPSPLPGAQPFDSQLSPDVGYDIPTGHLVTDDTGDITVIRFDGIPTGGLLAMRVRDYPGAAGRDLATAVAADDRLRVVRSQPTTVGGEPATRLVVRPVPGVTASPWFCPVGDRPCFDLSPTGRSILYLFEHEGTRYVLSGGAVNDSGADKIRPITDGAAATWHW